MDDDPYATRHRPPRPPAPAPEAGGETPDEGATRQRVHTAEVGDSARATLAAPPSPVAAPTPEPAAWIAAPGPSEPARSRSLRLLVGAALIVVAGGGFAAGWLSHSPTSATPTATSVPPARAPFVVTSVAASRSAGRLACPSAVAHLTATMTADHGGGTITYDWLLPHHASTAPARVTLATDQSEAVATLAYTIAGRTPLTGSATLHVISPLDAYSAPVALHYSCSSAKAAKAK